jgi:beta-1,4-mannosyltransferase
MPSQFMSHPTPEPPHRPFRIAAFPAGVTKWSNPYFVLCHSALAKRGISVSDDLEIDLAWLKARVGSVDAIHLHWPEQYWRRGGISRLSRIERAVVAWHRLLHLKRFVRAARRLGMRSLWTVHNLEPHEGAYRWDRYGYRLLARECDLVICHSHSATAAVRNCYRARGSIVVMPIGDCSGAHPAARPRNEVLGSLHLDPRRPVVSCLGRLREYKGLDLACQAIEWLNGQVQLIIGGPRHGDFDVTSIRALIDRIPGAVLIDRTLTDQEFSDLMGASDAALLSYRAITGSSALIAALGFGCGVVTSDLPYFQEILADEPDAGRTVRGWDPAAWANGILEYLARPAAVRKTAALRLAARYSWDRCVDPLVAALGVRDRANDTLVQTAAGVC